MPIVVLYPKDDGIALYRALARILVRHELKFASAISESTDCENVTAAG
jgi:hypothetical protein